MLHVQLTADDYIAALYTHSTFTRMRWLRMGLITVALMAFIYFQMPHDPWFVATLIASYGAILLLTIALVRYVFLPWQGRRIYAQTKAMQRPYKWTWDDERMSYVNDLASGIVPWEDVLKWREGPEQFLVYQSNIMFYLFPKRAFANEAAIDEFRALLKKKIQSPSPPQAAF